MSGWNLPDGCEVGDIPGFRPIDAKYDNAEERLDNMDTDEKLDLFEEMFTNEAMVTFFNESLMDDMDEDDDTWFEDYDDATDEEKEKMLDYILSFKRDDVLDYIVENY